MSKFTVKPGSTLSIGIRGDAESPVEKERARFIGVETQGDDYVFRKQGTTLHFYEIDPDAGIYEFPLADLTPPPAREVTLEKAQELDAANAAALAADSVVELNAREGEWLTQSYAFDADPGPGWTQSGLRTVRMFIQSAPYGQFAYREADQQDSDKGSNRIRFKTSLQGKGSLSVGDDLFWRRFDTSFDPDFPAGPGQNGYKVTTEPSFDAPRAALAIRGGNVKVYLKRLPRVFAVTAFRRFYVPYPFWNDAFAFIFNEPNLPPLAWVYGGQIDARHPFEGFKDNSTSFRDFALHWQARLAANPSASEQATAEAATLTEETESYFQRLLADNGLVGSNGYNWFPLAYSWTEEQRELVARFYEDIPRGFFLHNGHGEVFSSQWAYEGEFVGGIGYQGATYYVWRYTTGHANSHFGQVMINVQMSHPSWAGGLEPGFLFSAEGDIVLNPTNVDLHQVQDTTRDQFLVLPDGVPDLEGESLAFTFGSKFWTDFDARPRRFQT